MIYAAMVFAWICGILSVAPMVFVSTIVVDGICFPYFVWDNQATRQIINVWILISYFVVPVIVFVFCYARIVIVMRRQIRVMAAHNVEGSAHNAEGSAQMNASQIQSERIKWNIVKTMIIIVVPAVLVNNYLFREE